MDTYCIFEEEACLYTEAWLPELTDRQIYPCLMDINPLLPQIVFYLFYFSLLISDIYFNFYVALGSSNFYLRVWYLGLELNLGCGDGNPSCNLFDHPDSWSCSLQSNSSCKLLFFYKCIKNLWIFSTGSFVCKVGGTCTVLPFNGRSLASRNVDIFNHIYPHPNGKGIPHTILENCDSDKDSKISHDEMVRCYKEQHPLKNLTEIFIELDVNKDGFISIKEIDADADL